jgi:ABC-type Fe3+ transport system substrate-binding protein
MPSKATEGHENRLHKNENELIVYGPFHKTFFDFLTQFRHRYYGLDIDLTYYAAHPIEVVQKVRDEVKYGIPTADVVMLPHYTTLMLKESGHLRDYRSPELSAYDPMFKDKDGMWSAMAVEPTNFIYNRQLLEQRLVPTKLMDLTNPELRGKVSMQSTQDWSDGMYSFFYFATLLSLIGEKKWDAFVKDFLKNVKPEVFACYHNMQKYVSRGDYAIGLPLPLIKVGWAVETLNLSDVPTTASMRSIGIVAGGKHQHNAELFINHLLSQEWQNSMGKMYEGLIPTRPGATMKYNAPFRNPTTAMKYFPDEHGVKDAFSPHSLLEKFKSVGLP